MRRNVKLVISYDGTDFSGWQIQSTDRSVQGDLEAALTDLHNIPVSISAAGRTDSGVHAVGQVGNFYTEKNNIPAGKFREALNSRLPRDIRILSSTEVPDSFHSRRDAVNRQYEYRLIEGAAAPAHLSRYTWLHRRLPSLKLLNEMASELCGIHDFTTFAAAGDVSNSKVRELRQAAFLSTGSEIVFRISGNAFLWRMVRSIVGSLIHYAGKGGDATTMRAILESRDREAAGPTAPPQGLFLTKVTYGSDSGVR